MPLLIDEETCRKLGGKVVSFSPNLPESKWCAFETGGYPSEIESIDYNMTKKEAIINKDYPEPYQIKIPNVDFLRFEDNPKLWSLVARETYEGEKEVSARLYRGGACFIRLPTPQQKTSAIHCRGGRVGNYVISSRELKIRGYK